MIKKSPLTLTITAGLLLPLSIFSMPSNAQSDKVNHCRTIQDSNERVACYDEFFASNGNEKLENTQADKGTLADKSVEEKRLSASDNFDSREQSVMIKNDAVDSSSTNSKPPVQSNVDPLLQKQQSNTDAFGAESIAPEKSEADIDEMRASLTDIQNGLREYDTFTLDNGQIWKQTELSQLRLKNGDAVVIKKGFFGAYYLGTPDNNRQFRVKRIK